MPAAASSKLRPWRKAFSSAPRDSLPRRSAAGSACISASKPPTAGSLSSGHSRATNSGEMTEAEAAEFRRNDHPEEALLAQVAPDLRRQVARLVDLVVVEHAAQGGHLVREKGPLALAQRVRPDRGQRIEIGPAGEQLSFEAHGAGLERRALRVAQGRQRRRERFHGLAADPG